MQRTLILSIAAAVLAVAGLTATPALAQRVFVAAQGSDTNPCSFAAPCRTFQRAHDVVAAGGEIDVLDPAGYGQVTITKAISIQGHGFAGVSVPTLGFGITVSAGAGDAVSLNGILIDGTWIGSIGIEYASGKSLVVENCVVRRMTSNGINFISNTTALQTLSVSNSYFTDNDGAGIFAQTNNTGGLAGSIERTAFYGNHHGINLLGSNGTGTITVTASDSVTANNLIGAATVSLANHSATVLLLKRSAVSGNGVGVSATSVQSSIWLDSTAVTGNGVGFSNPNNGAIFTYGNNYIDSNTTNDGFISNVGLH